MGKSSSQSAQTVPRASCGQLQHSSHAAGGAWRWHRQGQPWAHTALQHSEPLGAAHVPQAQPICGSDSLVWGSADWRQHQRNIQQFGSEMLFDPQITQMPLHRSSSMTFVPHCGSAGASDPEKCSSLPSSGLSFVILGRIRRNKDVWGKNSEQDCQAAKELSSSGHSHPIQGSS